MTQKKTVRRYSIPFRNDRLPGGIGYIHLNAKTPKQASLIASCVFGPEIRTVIAYEDFEVEDDGAGLSGPEAI